MKIRMMTFLCIAAITISCSAMFKESEVTSMADDSTESEQKFRAYLSSGDFYRVCYSQGNYTCQHFGPQREGPGCFRRVIDKTPEESRALFLAIQGLYAKRQQPQVSKAPWWASWCSLL